MVGAEGEHQAAEKLASAGRIIGQSPTALQLRYLQTLLELGAEGGSTIAVPLPVDLIEPALARLAPTAR